MHGDKKLNTTTGYDQWPISATFWLKHHNLTGTEAGGGGAMYMYIVKRKIYLGMDFIISRFWTGFSN